MRVALRAKGPPQVTVSGSMSYPAPVGGWNARDAFADMDPLDAISLDNWFPRTSYCELRGGYTSFATGLTNNGKTLATYNGLDGTNYMFCLTQSGVYDVSVVGAVGASKAARTNGKHQWVDFGDGTNNYLILVNGVDKPLYFNGTAWVAVDAASSPALTGLTTTKIVHVNSFKGRLFFIEKDSLSFWYLAAGAAGGALTEFDLSGEATQGGFLMAMATWTVDAGNGPDDRAVFVTSEGEVIIYQGTNPSAANSWAKVGSYYLGKPLGRRCFTKYGGDLVLVTQNGTFPLSTALQSATINYKEALSDKIEKAFTEAARSYGTVFGWKPIVFPAQSALIVNIPLAEDGTHWQFAMNTITQSWCRFTGWDAEDFAIYNSDLYFCSGTAVYKAWSGVVDGINDIVCYGKTAFSYFRTPGLLKTFKMYEPVLATNGNINYLTDIDVDFEDDDITGTAAYTATSAALWDIALWDVDVWAAGLEIVKNWTSPNEYPGYCAAGKLKISTHSLSIQWMANNWIFERGGQLG